MRLSTRARYGLRAMISIAKKYPGYVSSEQIAEEEKVSKRYLDRLLATLRNSGLLRGSRGKGGGYCLAEDASSITALEVVEALEGEIALVPCVLDESVCDRASTCATRRIWIAMSRSTREVLDGITLAQLAAVHGIQVIEGGLR